MSRSWFYLTLWNGTPPEFTEEIDINIQELDAFDASVRRTNAAQTNIMTGAAFTSNIRSREAIDTDVVTSTGVVWYVH